MKFNAKKVAAYTATALVSLVAGAAMAGGSSDSNAAPTRTITHTVTGPTRTVTVNKAPEACKRTIIAVSMAGKMLSDATTIYVHQIKAAYVAGVTGGSVSGIVAKEHAATDIVRKATDLIDTSHADVKLCGAN